MQATSGGNHQPSTYSLVEEALEVAGKRRWRPDAHHGDNASASAETSLRQRVNAAIKQADELFDGHLDGHDEAHGFDDLSRELRNALGLVRDGVRLRSRASSNGRAHEAMTCAIELQELLEQVGERQIERRLGALANVREALARLEGIESVAQLKDRGTKELCALCGFDRAILFRREGPELVGEALRFTEDPDWGQAVLEFAGRARPRLDNGIREGDALRRRTAILVSDAQTDAHTYRPLVIATDTRAYVAAPIMPQGEVIGFLHGDRYFRGDGVDEFDRDVLWTFAEGFGYALGRAALVEDLRSGYDGFRHAYASAEAAMSRICEGRVALATSTNGSLQPDVVDRSALLLTARQRQVLELMAEGATNAEIASRLVLSPDTIKFHVRQILKRLQAANRAEAVSRYIRLLGDRSRQFAVRSRPPLP